MTAAGRGFVRQAAKWVTVAVLPAILTTAAHAQQHSDPMGTVSTRDARVTGGLEVQGDTTRLLTNASITAAPDHPAPITLARGGGVLVCSTSEFHLLRSGPSGALLFGLDRGAVQIVTQSHTQDAVLTPDLKLIPVTKGLLDLKLRVTREGDTCVDNSGADAPVLNATDPFSSASYRVLPGQHVLFVKGDLHRVVDHERSSCGCPATAPPRLAATPPGQPATPAQAAAITHPFPQAESEGLAPTTEASNEAPAGTAGSQVTTTFSYGEGQGPPPELAPAPAAGTSGATGPASTASTEYAPKEPGLIHAIGRFFHRLFHSGK